MKAEETKKLDAMMEIPATKAKGKKKKKSSKAQPSEPEEPPPQDELPISLPATPSGPGMRVIYPDRQIPKEEVDQLPTTSEEKAESDHTHAEEAVRGGEAGDGGKGEEEEGESESEEEESEEEKGEEGKEDEEVAAKKKPPQEKKETATDLISDTYNGAALDNYKWSQTMTDIDVKVPIAPGTRSKDVTVEIKNDHLKVMLHKPERKVRSYMCYCNL